METYGRYSLIEAIGAGSVTASFRAKRVGVEGFEKELVIKRVHSALAHDQDFLDSFSAEVKKSISLSHGSIAQVLDLGAVETADVPSYFLATEYIAGVTLAHVVESLRRRNQRLPTEIGLYLAIELAKVADYAHRQRNGGDNETEGIAHGGISLRNVMLSHEGELKVTDFRVMSTLIEKNVRAAIAPDTGLIDSQETLLSPEQSHGAPPSAKSDIFSMAALIYRCFLAGIDGEQQALHAPIHHLLKLDRLPRLGIVRSDLPPALSTLIERALELDPAKRVATAGDLHETLLDLISSKRLRSGRSDVAGWLARLGEATPSAGSSAGSGLLRLNEPRADTTIFSHVSLLALHCTDDLSLHEQDSATAVMSRFAERIIWRSASQALAIFAERDGRDTEVAVRCGLTLLRTLRTRAKTIGIAVDLALDRAPGNDAPTMRPGISEIDQLDALSRASHGGGRLVVTRRAARELRYLFKLKRLAADLLAVVGSRPLAQASGAFSNRRQELAWLLGLQKRPRTPFAPVALLGPLGIGKTRLLSEFSERAFRAMVPATVCIATCPPQGDNIAYSGVVALLARLCEIHEGDSFEQWERTKPHHAIKGFEWQDVELVLRMFQTAPIPDSANDARLTVALLRHIRARHGDVFVIDNAHHLDSESTRVLRKVFAALSNESLLFIFSARSNPKIANSSIPNQAFGVAREKDALALALGFPGLETLELKPLDEASQKEIIKSRLHVEAIPDALAEYFLSRTEGNPFVLEELLREGIGQGQIVLGPGRIKEFRAHLPFALPHSVRTLRADLDPSSDRN